MNDAQDPAPEKVQMQPDADELHKLKAEMDEMDEKQAGLPPRRIAALKLEVDDLKLEVDDLKASKDHLFKSTVVAESLVAQLVNLLHETENKRLAALVMSGDLEAHHFEDRRAKAAHELRSRVSVLRNRARDAANNLSSAQPPR